MGMFGKKIGGGTVRKRNPYWQEGKFVVEITLVKGTTNHKKQDVFIISGIPLESTNEAVRIGVEHDQIINLDAHESGVDNALTFCAALLDADEAKIKEDTDVIDAICAEENPMKGTLMLLSCHMTTTRKGNDFTVHTWSTATDELRERHAELRKAAGL